MAALKKMKTIVITGTTHGLGKALAARLIDKGHIVAGCGRSEDQIRKLKKSYNSDHDFTVVDIASNMQVRVWARRVLAHLGPPDLVINNAGIASEPASLWEVSESEINRIIDINIKGVINVIRGFATTMVLRKRGVIANISSGWGRTTSPEVASYCMTKWAIEGLTQSLSQELPKGMAAVAVNPGIINTRLLKTCFGSEAKFYPNPDEWAVRAADFFIGLGPRDNGKSLDIV